MDLNRYVWNMPNRIVMWVKGCKKQNISVQHSAKNMKNSEGMKSLFTKQKIFFTAACIGLCES